MKRKLDSVETVMNDTVEHKNYHCSDYRVKLCAWVDNCPKWRRWLLCKVLYHRDVRLAWALGMAANVYLFEPDGSKIGNDLLKRSDAIWAEIYSYYN